MKRATTYIVFKALALALPTFIQSPPHPPHLLSGHTFPLTAIVRSHFSHRGYCQVTHFRSWLLLGHICPPMATVRSPLSPTHKATVWSHKSPKDIVRSQNTHTATVRSRNRYTATVKSHNPPNKILGHTIHQPTWRSNKPPTVTVRSQNPSTATIMSNTYPQLLSGHRISPQLI